MGAAAGCPNAEGAAGACPKGDDAGCPKGAGAGLPTTKYQFNQNLNSVVDHFIVIKRVLDALIKMKQSLSQNKITYKVLLGPRMALLELVRT